MPPPTRPPCPPSRPACPQCPHHEAPNAVSKVVSEWILAAEARLGAARAGGDGGLSSDSYSSADASDGPGGGAGGSGSGGAAAGDLLLVDGPLALGESLSVVEAHGGAVTVSHVAGAPRNVFERVDAAVWGLRARLRGAR
jgi:hypothetical protein